MVHGLPVTAKNTKRILEENDFCVLKVSGDGKIGNKNIKVKPIYNEKKWGFWEVFEILAKKI